MNLYKEIQLLADEGKFLQACFKSEDLIKQQEKRIKELEGLLSEIYDTFKEEPYFRSTGRFNIAIWIKSICKRIKAL